MAFFSWTYWTNELEWFHRLWSQVEQSAGNIQAAGSRRAHVFRDWAHVSSPTFACKGNPLRAGRWRLSLGQSEQGFGDRAHGIESSGLSTCLGACGG